MLTENEHKDVQKAMAYDLLRILKQNPEKAYTAKELEALIDAYNHRCTVANCIKGPVSRSLSSCAPIKLTARLAPKRSI